MSEALLALHADIRACVRCPLAQTRRHAVPGDGSLQASVMIIGEAPGQNEDIQGLPFVGAAGQLLNQLLAGIGMKREDVFITNIVKCRPPNNRDPLPQEVEACADYLNQQVAEIRPAVILLLGRHALQRLLPGSDGISRVHGKLIERGDRAYVPLYHPAAALYNSFLVETLQQDFAKVKGYIETIDARRRLERGGEPVKDPEEQLSLF